MLDAATLEDLDQLVDLEQRCFDSDRMSRRSFRRMLTRANAAVLVDRDGGRVRGYALVLFHAGSSLARLYSLAVDPADRGHGIARALLAEAERIASERDCVDMRLELRRDNREALQLYENAGYRQFEVQADYYEDHTDALRMELEADGAPVHVTLIKPASIDTPYTKHARSYLENEPTLPPPVVWLASPRSSIRCARGIRDR